MAIPRRPIEMRGSGIAIRRRAQENGAKEIEIPAPGISIPRWPIEVGVARITIGATPIFLVEEAIEIRERGAPIPGALLEIGEQFLSIPIAPRDRMRLRKVARRHLRRRAVWAAGAPCALLPPMRRPKYPLEPLAELRDRRIDAAVGELAGAVREREKAERARAEAEQRRTSHEAASAEVRRGEADALARGELRAADLTRGGAWELRIAAERAKQDETVDRARGEEGRAIAGEKDAKGKVASAEADAKVVSRDREKWNDAVRRREEAREEEAAAEAWRRKG